MEKNKNLRVMFIFNILMVVVMIFVMKGMGQKQKAVVPAKPEAAVAMSQDAITAADNDQTKLNDVFKKFNEVANANKETELAAQARLQMGILQETKLEVQPAFYSKWTGIGMPKPGEKQEQLAVVTYRGILKDFSPDKSAAAKEAEIRLENLGKALDKKSSKKWEYKVLDTLVSATGRNPHYSYFFALLIVTIVFKLITTPLSHKQFQSMKEMQKIQPLIKQLQEKYKGDQKVLGEKVMGLYKEHGVNPFGSCLPILVQLPVLWIMFGMVRAYEFQFAQANFLWIGSALSHKLPAFVPVIFGFKIPLIATSLAMPDLLLLIVYTVSMIISQKMTVVDPTQAEQQKIMMYMMPIMFGVIFIGYASAFMLYWLMFNIISTVQQYYIMKPTTTPALATAGGPSIAPSQVPGEVKSKPAPNKSKKKKK